MQIGISARNNRFASLKFKPVGRDKTCIKKSTIHGRGLFATRKIDEGELIGHVSGVWTVKEGAHVLWLDKNRAFRVHCNLRYINHCVKPNAVYYDTREVIALHDINAGDEITHDYGW